MPWCATSAADEATAPAFALTRAVGDHLGAAGRRIAVGRAEDRGGHHARCPTSPRRHTTATYGWPRPREPTDGAERCPERPASRLLEFGWQDCSSGLGFDRGVVEPLLPPRANIDRSPSSRKPVTPIWEPAHPRTIIANQNGVRDLLLGTAQLEGNAVERLLLERALGCDVGARLS
jgi:hypothetical protein